MNMGFFDAAQKILREAGKSFTAEEITKIAFEKGLIKTSGKTPSATMGARIYTDIKTNQDKSVFVKVERGRFGLREWETKGRVKAQVPVEPQEMPIANKLLETQRNSDAPTMFEKAIAEVFNFLGLQAKQIGGRDEPDILIEIDSYKIILDGKSTREGVITSETAIGFERLERYKEKYNASYIGVIAPGFSEGYIRETAKKRGIILIETEAICRILQNHATYPYEPNHIVEILFKSDKDVITSKDIPPSTIDQEKLIKIVAKILSDIKLTRKTSFSSRELHIAYSWQGLSYESDEIENALKFLSVAPFSILQKQNDEYSLTGDIEFILKKIGLLLQAFNRIGR
jgi:DNA-directed RNA polymerase delta subunit